jgi:hypothetical protein
VTRRPAKVALSAHDLRRLAVAAEVDPRAVQRCLAGRPVRRSTRMLVIRAAADLGIDIPAIPEAK